MKINNPILKELLEKKEILIISSKRWDNIRKALHDEGYKWGDGESMMDFCPYKHNNIPKPNNTMHWRLEIAYGKILYTLYDR